MGRSSYLVYVFISFLFFSCGLSARQWPYHDHALQVFFHVKLPDLLEIFPLLVIFAPFIYFGLSPVDHINLYLMVGMFLAFSAIAAWLIPHVEVSRLIYINWPFSVVIFCGGHKFWIPCDYSNLSNLS